MEQRWGVWGWPVVAAGWELSPARPAGAAAIGEPTLCVGSEIGRRREELGNYLPAQGDLLPLMALYLPSFPGELCLLLSRWQGVVLKMLSGEIVGVCEVLSCTPALPAPSQSDLSCPGVCPSLLLLLCTLQLSGRGESWPQRCHEMLAGWYQKKNI